MRTARFTIRAAERLAPGVMRLRIEAPRVARHRQPGQFVIVRVDEDGERIPLTVADADLRDDTITLVVQAVGRTTAQINALRPGDTLADVAGPLGRGADLTRYGTAAVVAGGVGSAIAYPRAVALKQSGNEVIVLLGGRTRELVTLEAEMREIADEVRPVTDDGSYGRQGLVTDALVDLLAERRIDHVLTAGPVPMMAAVADVTRPHGIHTLASLNPIMVDGTGMCGGCRVDVGGKTVFACVDGPEFNAHEVDFALLARRNRSYLEFERARAEMADLEVPPVSSPAGGAA